jgi:hypothetical protein
MRTLATATLPLPIVLALLFAPLQTLSGTAYACSCIPTTVEERVQSADVVAIGTVVSLYEDETTEDGIFVDMDGVVRVSAYYKGSGPSEIAVDDPADEGVCGIIADDSVGREAVLFLTLDDGEYLTHLCAGTQFFSSTDDFLAGTIAEIEAVTGPGQPPDESPPQEEPTEGDESTPWAVILPLAFLIPLAVLIVPAFLLRRRGGH